MTRDPAKPRGKMTAYAFFVQNYRQEQKRLNPDQQVVFAEFSKRCASIWKELTSEQKQPFEDMTAKDKLRWEEEMRHYVAPDGRKTKKTKRKKDPNAPKRPQTAFFLFCADERPGLRQQFPDLRIGDIAKKLGTAWSACEGPRRTKYEETAATQKEEYRLKMEMYRKGQYPGNGNSHVAQPQQQQQLANDDGEFDDSDWDTQHTAQNLFCIKQFIIWVADKKKKTKNWKSWKFILE